MVRFGATRLGVFVGAILTAAIGCGADAQSAVTDLDDAGFGAPFELATKPEELLIPQMREPSSGDVCASQTVVAEPVAVNLYLMIDRSGSMQEGNKWGQSMDALRRFVEAPEADGLRVALRFFGDDEPVVGCSQHECSAEACAEPLVEAATLTAAVGVADAQERTLVEILQHTLPVNGFGTPIYPALGGALAWAVEYKTTHANEKVAVVFLTDGEPNGCDTNIDHISGLATAAFASHGIRTYAIGLAGSNERQIDQIAVAGQTHDGIFIGDSAGAEEKLLQALDDVRSRAMSCDFLLPTPRLGETADLQTLNLTMQTASGEAELYRVDSLEACTDDGLGWYFDAEHAPNRIHLCPTACAASNQQADTRMNLVMGCIETRLEPTAVR